MVFMYDTGDLSKPLYEDSIDECPAILVPYYDEDSNTVFLSGRVSTCLKTMTSDVILSIYSKKNPLKCGYSEYAYNEFTLAVELVSFSLVLKPIINLSFIKKITFSTCQESKFFTPGVLL